MIVISSVTIASVTLVNGISETPEDKTQFEYPTQPCNVRSVITETGTWVSFDSSTPGTPAESHVTISDTSGITIVIDFHGFWRNNCSINGTEYDDLDMPGATLMRETGKPMLPCLFEYLEIPYNIDVSIDVLASSTNTTSGYNIRPAPLPIIPTGGGVSFPNTTSFGELPITLDSVYNDNVSFPSFQTNTEGESNTTSIVMRGRRILGLTLYPIQYNPVTQELEVNSQLVIKVKYSIPAQINPPAIPLWSKAFEFIFKNTLLNYQDCNIASIPHVGYGIRHPPPPPGTQEGAEYLIITNATFREEALKLANWKVTKGVPTKIEIIEEGATTEDVKEIIFDAYNEWYPAPTYVLLLGDVEVIPANYDLQHRGQEPRGILGLGYDVFWGAGPVYDKGYIASDLGYFNIDGYDYIPDMIYGRISVDTVEQARIIVNKILNYTQTPPFEPSFYTNILNAGQFEDRKDYNAIEDNQVPFLYTLERIRHYLKDSYNVHVNYSCYWQHYDSPDVGWDSPDTSVLLENLRFRELLDISDTDSSYYLIDSLADIDNFEWLWAYVMDPTIGEIPFFYDDAREDITKNIIDGRFLFLYYGHGGSKNMKYIWAKDYTTNNRDYVEGLYSPYYNTSYFSELNNGDMLPLILCMSCSSGWFDGETDETVLDIYEPPPNPFEDYENECFAENITRLEGGGAIAAIAASRPAYGEITQHLLNGMMQAFWPGFLDSQNQPMYEMGTALLYSKLYAKRNYVDPLIAQTTFEEFHLFGDPEVELWTDVPTNISVSYPRSVGTTDPQRFVVTVNNIDTGLPVNYAKVCIQQGESIYEVGYTNPRGQVIFDVNPSATPSHINVTVTKHNFRPHIGNMIVYDSIARLSLSDYSVMDNEILTITLVDFPDDDTYTFFGDEYLLTSGMPSGTTEYHWDLDGFGPNRYINVWVGEYDSALLTWSAVSVDRFAIISMTDGPDPWIYSHNDRSTWDDPTDEIVWDNPDINIKLNGVTVSSMNQNEIHDIEVTVHNRGSDSEIPTTVTLYYAPFGGGVSWTPIGDYPVNPEHEGTDLAYFTLNPPIPFSACLKVVLDHIDELPENTINNIGLENIDVIQMSSPGERSFLIGNPTNYTDYVTICVKQQGYPEDVWNASIQSYSSQAMGIKLNETIELIVDPKGKVGSNEWRLFTAEIYVNGEIVGGMVFNATVSTGLSDNIWTWILFVAGASIIVAAVIYVKIKK